jgi:hypothetical protein
MPAPGMADVVLAMATYPSSLYACARVPVCVAVRPFPDPDVIDITRPRVLAAQGSGGQCSLG